MDLAEQSRTIARDVHVDLMDSTSPFGFDVGSISQHQSTLDIT